MAAILVSLETTLDTLSIFYKKKAKSPEVFLDPGCGLWRYWWQSCFDGQPFHQAIFDVFFLDGLILMMVQACFSINLSL